MGSYFKRANTSLLFPTKSIVRIQQLHYCIVYSVKEVGKNVCGYSVREGLKTERFSIEGKKERASFSKLNDIQCQTE